MAERAVASGGVNARVISQTRSTATAPSNDTPHGTTGQRQRAGLRVYRLESQR